jgi:ferredoxin-NADP reductase
MEHILKIREIKQVTHDVKCFRLEKPTGYHFTPGQATDVSINKPGWENELRPFTFTCLNSDPYLEFTIKRYTDHNGVTNQLHQLLPGNELILREVWGAIEYKGPGYFIAGGAGITPFMAILRKLNADHSLQDNFLFFSNKTSNDLIYEQELKQMLGNRVSFILSKETSSEYISGRINEDFLKDHVTDFKKHFYICGPDPMIAELTEILKKMGANPDALVFEK